MKVKVYNQKQKKTSFENQLGLIVTAEECNGDIERMIRKFKKKVMKSGILLDLKAKQFYEKPSDKKRRRKKESIKRIQRENEKLMQLMAAEEE